MPQIRTIPYSGSIPTTTQLALGDIAINTFDGKAYIKQASGSTQSIIELGTGGASVSASYASTASYSFFAVTAAFAQNFNPSATASYAISASYALTATTSSYAFTAVSSSYALTAGTASYVLNTVSASYATNALSSSYALTATTASYALSTLSASFASTASYVNTLNQNVTVNGNLTVTGTASFTYVTGSIVKVGSSTIILNTDYPAIRFGGMTVVDSGSFGNSSTGSLLWDSLENRWIYSNPSGSNYDGGMLISGPRNTSGLGNEQGTTANALMKGQGGDHITSSRIFEDSSGNVAIGATGSALAKLEVVGNVYATSFTGSLFGTASNAVSSSYAATASYVLNAVSASFATTASYYKTFPYTGSALITGSLGITGSTSVNSGTLSVYKSGSTVVDIQGSQGQLFSVIDALSGSLMSVNDISGLPILEVFSDDRVVMGTYGAPGLVVSGSSIIATGSLFGTASYAVSSSVVYISNKSTANVDYPLIFKGDSAALDDYRTLAADTAGPYYNPLKNTLGSVSGLIISASSFYGPLTGSLLGTASYADNAKVFPFTGSATISGSLTVEGNVTVNSATTIDLNTSVLNINAPTIQVPSFSFPYSPSANVRTVMYDAVSNILFVTASLPGGGGSSFTGSFTGSLTGSLLGTASYATYALGAGTANSATSASYALSASYSNTAVSSSYALNATTASYVLNAISASYSANALSASYALNATTASYSINALSSSYALSGSFTNFALTASYALNAADSIWTGSAGGIFYNGGNVGIGTSAPAYKLHVSGSGASSYIYIDNGFDGTYYNKVKIGGGYIQFGRESDNLGGLSIFGNSNNPSMNARGSFRFTIDASRGFLLGEVVAMTVYGAGTTSSTKSLLVQDSAGSAILETYDSGYVVVRQGRGINFASSVNTWDNIQSTSGGPLSLSPYWGVRVIGTYPGGYSDPNIPLLHVTRSLAASPSLKIEESGNTRLIVTNSGSVGIGTVSPGTTLDVVGDIQASNYLYGNVATITPLVLNIATNDLTVENTAVGYNLVLKTSGAERMRVTSVGDVGIGTFSPAAKLEIVGNVKATSFTGSLFGTASYAIFALGAGAANSATSASYALSSSYALVATTASYAINALSSSYALVATTASYAVNALSSSYALSGSFSNFALTASYALNAGDSIWTGSGVNIYYNLGNVGIGVTNPTYKLHVSSSNNNDGIAVHYPATNSTQFPFYVGDNSNGVYARLNATEFEFKRNGNGSTIKTVGSSNNLVLESANNLVFNTNGATTQMYINTSGNVGIGTTSPAYLLDVTGVGNFRNIGAQLVLNGGFGAYEFATTTGNAFTISLSGTAERMRILSDGNIGINTLSPGDKLEVVGNVYADAFNSVGTLSRYNSTGGIAIAGLAGNPYAYISAYVNGGGAGKNLVLQPSSGSVGIGTTNPAATLEVSGNVKAVSFTGSFSGSINSAVSASYALSSSYALTATTASYAISALSSSYALSGSYSNFALTASYALNAADSVWTGSGTDIYYNQGNVGIGVTNPVSRLQINKSSQTYSSPTASGALVLSNLAGGNAVLDMGVDATNLSYLQSRYINNSAVYQLLLNPGGGNIGIGTTSAGAELAVNSGNSNTRIFLQNAGSTKLEIGYGPTGYGFTHPTGEFIAHSDNLYFGQIASVNTNVTFTTGGAVGIGTTNPSSALDAIVSSGGTPGLRFRGYSDAGTPYLLSLGTYSYPDQFQIKSVNGLVTMGIVGATGANPDLAFQTNTTERMRITTGGNVGIGTTNPQYPLDLGTGGSGNSIRARRIYANGTGIDSGFTLDNTLIYQDSSTRFNITNPGSYPNVAFSINTGGNIGIGTTGQSGILDVQTSNTGTQLVRFWNTDTSGTGASAVRIANSGNNNNGSRIEFTDNSYYVATIAGDRTQGLTFRTDATGASPTGTPIRMTILPSGNVGIGTTNPATRLQVLNTASPYQISVKSDTSKVWSMGVGISGYYQEWFLLNDGSTDIFRINAGYTEITNNLYASANVGIGTGSPTQKLDVAGAISVSGSVIDYEVSPALIGPGPAVNIVSFVPGTTKAAFVDYVIVDSSGATNQRVGTIMISISLNTVSAVMNEVTTLDIGNTSAITFAVAYGAPTWLTATNSGITPYDISYMVRYF